MMANSDSEVQDVTSDSVEGTVMSASVRGGDEMISIEVIQSSIYITLFSSNSNKL